MCGKFGQAYGPETVRFTRAKGEAAPFQPPRCGALAWKQAGPARRQLPAHGGGDAEASLNYSRTRPWTMADPRTAASFF